MKKILPAIAATLFLLLPAAGLAAYIIHLHDGTRFVTDQYYEQGDQIRFKRYGGIIGIEKALVREIEEIEDLPEQRETPSEVEASKAVAETDKKEKNQEQAPGGDAPKPEEAGGDEKIGGKGQETEKRMPTELSEEEKIKAEQEKQAFLDEKRRVMREMEEATSAFKEAKATKKREKKNQYWNELLALQKKLAELRDRVMAEHGGEVPAWWDSD